jgi:hypothetical protein
VSPSRPYWPVPAVRDRGDRANSQAVDRAAHDVIDYDRPSTAGIFASHFSLCPLQLDRSDSFVYNTPCIHFNSFQSHSSMSTCDYMRNEGPAQRLPPLGIRPGLHFLSGLMCGPCTYSSPDHVLPCARMIRLDARPPRVAGTTRDISASERAASSPPSSPHSHRTISWKC